MAYRDPKTGKFAKRPWWKLNGLQVATVCGVLIVVVLSAWIIWACIEPTSVYL